MQPTTWQAIWEHVAKHHKLIGQAYDLCQTLPKQSRNWLHQFDFNYNVKPIWIHQKIMWVDAGMLRAMFHVHICINIFSWPLYVSVLSARVQSTVCWTYRRTWSISTSCQVVESIIRVLSEANPGRTLPVTQIEFSFTYFIFPYVIECRRRFTTYTKCFSSQ